MYFDSTNSRTLTRDYYILGEICVLAGENNRAIDLFKFVLDAFNRENEANEKKIKQTRLGLSLANNNFGMEFWGKKKYDKALPYFQIALENADAGEGLAFSLTCLNNIGSTFKYLGEYEKGLNALNQGLERAIQLNLRIDEELKKYPPENLKSSAAQAEIAKMKNLPVIRRIRYHRLGCLEGLGRKKEAEYLVPALYQESVDAQDAMTLGDLRMGGWVK